MILTTHTTEALAAHAGDWRSGSGPGAQGGAARTGASRPSKRTNAAEAPSPSPPPSGPGSALRARPKPAAPGAPPAPAASDFIWSSQDAPHSERRKAILAAHPEVKELYGVCPWTKYQVVFVVALHLACASFARGLPTWQWLLLAWALGGLCTSNLFLACHELAHNLAFQKPTHNKLLGLFANLPICIPFAISFQRYHLEHHSSQGVAGIDVDIPHASEARVVAAGGAFTKALWVSAQLFFYALRPLLIRPKSPRAWDAINLAVCAAFDVFLLFCPGFGLRAIAYLLASAVFGGGLHPAAGHFISEHYVFVEGQETYSYYGPWNWVTYTVGFHVEHHDFPRIPGSRLRKLHAAAPEFYDCLASHDSYTGVLWRYISDPAMGPFSRVMRRREDHCASAAASGESVATAPAEQGDAAEVVRATGRKAR